MTRSRRYSAAASFFLSQAALSLLLAVAPVSAGDIDSAAGTPEQEAFLARLQAKEKALKYRTGEIELNGGLAVVRLADGYRYLDEDETGIVLSEMWGNPPGAKTLGMILAPGQSPLQDDSWAVILEYEEDGYVKDDDAESIDYDDLLQDMQKSSQERNEEREKQGYEPIRIVGWAEKPRYDKATNKLHWAKEIAFGRSKENTLNYNIRILGRKGVLVLNAVAGMSSLPAVKEGIGPILTAVEFKEGNRYSEFDPKMDKVATYGIAGLVAGGVLAKVGFFKVIFLALLGAKKFLIIGLIALVAFAAKFFKGPSAQKEIKEVVKEIPDDRKDDKRV